SLWAGSPQLADAPLQLAPDLGCAFEGPRSGLTLRPPLGRVLDQASSQVTLPPPLLQLLVRGGVPVGGGGLGGEVAGDRGAVGALAAPPQAVTVGVVPVLVDVGEDLLQFFASQRWPVASVPQLDPIESLAVRQGQVARQVSKQAKRIGVS